MVRHLILLRISRFIAYINLARKRILVLSRFLLLQFSVRTYFIPLYVLDCLIYISYMFQIHQVFLAVKIDFCVLWNYFDVYIKISPKYFVMENEMSFVVTVFQVVGKSTIISQQWKMPRQFQNDRSYSKPNLTTRQQMFSNVGR